MQDGQDSVLVELAKTHDDSVADLPRTVMHGCLEKSRQCSSVLLTASDKPIDRLKSDAPVVVPQAPPQLVGRVKGLRYPRRR